MDGHKDTVLFTTMYQTCDSSE